MGFGLTKYFPFILYLSLVIIIVIIFCKIKIGIYYTIFFLPLQNVMDKLIVYPFGKSFLDILITALLIKSLLTYKQYKGGIFRERSNYLLVMLILYTLVETITFGGITELIDWKNYIRMILLYFIVYINVEKSDIRFVLITIVASMFCMDIYYRWNYYPTEHFDPSRRFRGTFSYLGPNELGIFYALYTPILFSLFYYTKKKVLKLFLGFVFFSNLYPLIYTFSRAAYLSFLFGISALSILKTRWLLPIIIVLILSWRLILPASVLERIDMVYDDFSGYDMTIKERTGLISSGYSEFLKSPIFGHGFGSTGRLEISDGITKIHRYSLHNGILQILVEMGVIGLLIFIGIYLFGAKSGWELYRASNEELLKGLGLGFLICSLTALFTLFTANFWYDLNVNAFFWVLFAITNKCKNMKNNILNQSYTK
jgi:O-antigen ligase